ncbi:UDP-glycosyltransferase UGT5-like [Culicoides brevitarsis]|uniref:UDP-glycosyltransferase UGT5-like n=1 Tax=Culicoides brevitarsis TaxID=469753 RepID=UPI00307BE0D0
MRFLLLLILGFLGEISPYKILLLAPFPPPSHYLWISHFTKALLDRGHHVTAITSNHAKFKHRNLTEVVVNPPFDGPKYLPMKDIFDMRYDNDWENLWLYWRAGLMTTEHALQTSVVQKFIQREDHFDLVLSEQFFQESFLMFAYKFDCPIVTIGTLGYSDFMDRAMGFHSPWATVPHSTLPYSSEMTFWERTYNVMMSLADAVLREWYYYPKQEHLAQTYFKFLKQRRGPLPSVRELEKNISAMLINTHFSINPPRPLMPGQINVAGAHIHPPNPLPEDIQTFLDGARNGVILFSLGSIIQSKEMPISKMRTFANVFKTLKQRVIMKYEDNMLPSVSPNVMAVKWLPQADILAHPNVILFITHGGIFGSQEAIYHGVPMLFIPFYGDQFRNALRAERDGYGLTLPWNEISASTLREKLNDLLGHTGYKEKAVEVSKLFRDNPMPVMEQAMYTIEYVIRNNGALHWKSGGIKLAWWQHQLWDVYFFLSVVIAISSVVVWKFVVMLVLLATAKKTTKRTKND